jgi:hypothetical protein
MNPKNTIWLSLPDPEKDDAETRRADERLKSPPNAKGDSR